MTWWCEKDGLVCLYWNLWPVHKFRRVNFLLWLRSLESLEKCYHWEFSLSFSFKVFKSFLCCNFLLIQEICVLMFMTKGECVCQKLNQCGVFGTLWLIHLNKWLSHLFPWHWKATHSPYTYTKHTAVYFKPAEKVSSTTTTCHFPIFRNCSIAIATRYFKIAYILNFRDKLRGDIWGATYKGCQNIFWSKVQNTTGKFWPKGKCTPILSHIETFLTTLQAVLA